MIALRESVRSETVANEVIEIKMFNDPWMDNGIENLYRILKEIESCNAELTENSMKFSIIDEQKFLKEFSKTVIEKRENLIVIEKDRGAGIDKEIKKDHIIIQEGEKVAGKVALKEEIYKPEKTLEIISKIFSSDSGKNVCILCGRSYDKSVKKLQQANYPFVTKIASLSGVRSYKDGLSISLKEYYDNLCPLCYLVGILEWTDEGVVYRTFPGDKSYMFLPHFDNLLRLHRFKRFCIYSGILDKSGRYSNIKVSGTTHDVEHTPGEFSTLLCFYEKFVENATEEIPARDWAVLQIPYGQVKNVKIDFISVDEGILGVIQRLKESGKLNRIYSDLMKRVFFYSQNKNAADREIAWEIQESLSKHFLSDDFRSFTKTLLPRKGGYVFFSSEVREYLEDLIFEWRWKNMGVSKEKLDSIKSVGNIVAKISENNASLLYKLDKVRNIDEFWSVLREIARKLPGLEDKDLKMVKPTALDELIQLVKEITATDKDGWKEIRDLVVVYASMYYSLNRLSKLPKGGGEE